MRSKFKLYFPMVPGVASVRSYSFKLWRTCSANHQICHLDINELVVCFLKNG